MSSSPVLPGVTKASTRTTRKKHPERPSRAPGTVTRSDHPDHLE